MIMFALKYLVLCTNRDASDYVELLCFFAINWGLKMDFNGGIARKHLSLNSKVYSYIS